MADYTLATQDASVMLTLPPPLRGFVRGAQMIGGTHVTLSGRQVQHVLAVKRTWEAMWERLPDATFEAIEAFWIGTHGLGPFEFGEPGRDAVLANITALDDSVQLQGFHSVRFALQEV